MPEAGYVSLREARRRAGAVPDDFAREFEAMFNDEAELPLHTTRFRAWCLLSAVQLASRHPEAMKTAPMRVAVERRGTSNRSSLPRRR